MIGRMQIPPAHSILMPLFRDDLNRTVRQKLDMNGTVPSKLARGESAAPGRGKKTILNTFAPSCQNEHLDGGMLFQLCKYGFPFAKLPDEGKELLLEYRQEYLKKCTKPGDPIPDIPELSDENGMIT